jgi:hypothetical protein
MDAKDKLLVPFRNISTPVLIALTLIIHLIFSLSTSSVARMYGISLNANFPPFDNLKQEFLLVVIFAPLVETLIFQYFLVNLSISLTMLLFKREYIILAIMMPAMAFGLAHTYNYMYMASTFVTGLLFNTFYMVVKYRKQDAYSCTTIVHGLYNLFIFGLKHT